MKLKLSSQSFSNVRLVLVVLAVTLAVFHVIGYVWSYWSDASVAQNFASTFDLDSERNVPTVYTGLLLGSIALFNVMLLNGSQKLMNKLVYVFLSLLFFYLAFDEILILHELVAEPVRRTLSISSVSSVYHAWVIPAIVGGLGVYGLSRLVRSENTVSTFQQKILTRFAALVFGVVLLEALGTKFYDTQIIYKLGPVLLEEMFEIGMISYILSLYVQVASDK